MTFLLEQTALDWAIQLPAAAAVVTVVIVFLKHMAKQSEEATTDMKAIGESCHKHSEQQTQQFACTLENMAGTFERTLDRFDNRDE
tara:strand:- start:408 stop:665 length:258 start_codon:yes stop_codon:yes gene_type:complete